MSILAQNLWLIVFNKMNMNEWFIDVLLLLLLFCRNIIAAGTIFNTQSVAIYSS